MDLQDYWRGRLTLRKIGALIRNLPSGSALGITLGGEAYWSQETTATLMEGWRIRSTLVGLLSGKSSAQPPPPSPPERDWMKKEGEREDMNMRRLQAWERRQQNRQQESTE